MLGFGDAKSLARKIEQIDKDKQKTIAESIMKGQFTFNEFYSHYQTVLEMGDLESFSDSMGMVKFVPNGIGSANMEEKCEEDADRDGLDDEEGDESARAVER
jgi:signal recognition particle GTPase